MKRLYNDILIREACTDDAQQLCSWWNDGKVMAHAGFPYGLGTTVETVRQQLEDKNNNSNRHIIIYKNIPIGEMNYCEAGEKTCEIGIKICDFSMQNKGLGKIILSLFITYYTEERWIMLKDLISTITTGLEFNTTLFVISFIVIIFLEIFNAIQCGFLGIVLGYRKYNNKIAFSGFCSYSWKIGLKIV